MEWLYLILFQNEIYLWFQSEVLTTLLSTSLLLFTSSPLLIAILKDQNVIEVDKKDSREEI